MAKDIASMGHTRVVLQGDNEPMRALAPVQQARQDLHAEDCSAQREVR